MHFPILPRTVTFNTMWCDWWLLIVPPALPQISHRLAWDQTKATGVRGWQPVTWAKARLVQRTDMLDTISTHTAASTVHWTVSREIWRLHACWQCHGLCCARFATRFTCYLAFAGVLELVKTHSAMNMFTVAQKAYKPHVKRILNFKFESELKSSQGKNIYVSKGAQIYWVFMKTKNMDVNKQTIYTSAIALPPWKAAILRNMTLTLALWRN